MDANRQTYQIKARMMSSGRGSRQLGAIRGLDREPSPFDSLVAILFDEHHNVVRAAKIPVQVVRDRAKYQEHTNSWIFMLKDDVWGEPNVIDITRELRAAAAN